MTVKQLKKALEGYSESLIVAVEGCDCDRFAIRLEEMSDNSEFAKEKPSGSFLLIISSERSNAA